MWFLPTNRNSRDCEIAGEDQCSSPPNNRYDHRQALPTLASYPFSSLPHFICCLSVHYICFDGLWSFFYFVFFSWHLKKLFCQYLFFDSRIMSCWFESFWLLCSCTESGVPVRNGSRRIDIWGLIFVFMLVVMNQRKLKQIRANLCDAGCFLMEWSN